MSRMKSVFAISLVIASLGIVPQGFAQTPKIIIAGSSAMWQTMALATYNKGTCLVGAGAKPPCKHATYGGFNLTDNRPATPATDSNSIWVVWDSTASSAGGPFVWAYLKVDSVVGQRCYFAQPRCTVAAPSTINYAAPANSIPQSLWGNNSADSPIPSVGGIQTLLNGGVPVSAAATDIRPEDGLFATCRANSALGTGAVPAGLGYNTNNATPGMCPTVNDNAHLTGTDIASEFSTATAHVIAYNITGSDPYSGTAIPAYTVVPAGMDPIVFVAKTSNGVLSPVTNVNDAQLHTVFGGTSCVGPDLGGSAGSIDAWLREPLSGTMNTVESNVFRYADNSGVSQEQGVDPSLANNNPLNKACGAGGTRKRGVGTGDVIGGLKANALDGITYTFFSYGNVSKLADSSTFRYLQLNGVDPIFHQYVSTAGGTKLDPGQPNASIGEIPSGADVPCLNGGVHSFPCSENAIWSGGYGKVTPFSITQTGLSFPNVRNGSYKAWSILRLVSDGNALTQAQKMASGSQTFAATVTPDYIPVLAVATAGDPGALLLRSHYQQVDGTGASIGGAPVNETTVAVTVGTHTYPAMTEAGGDMGGCILHLVPGISATAYEGTDFTTGCSGH